MEKIKVDFENGCIDRNTDFGKQFAEFNESIESLPADEKEFMAKLSSFAEASLIVENTLPKDQAEKVINQLKDETLK